MTGVSNFFSIISESKISECYMCPDSYVRQDADPETKKLREKLTSEERKLEIIRLKTNVERTRINLNRQTKELAHLKTIKEGVEQITEGTGGVKRSEKRAKIATAKAKKAKYWDKQDANVAASRAVNRADYVGLTSDARKNAKKAKTGPEKRLAQIHSQNAEEVIPRSARSSNEGGFKALTESAKSDYKAGNSAGRKVKREKKEKDNFLDTPPSLKKAVRKSKSDLQRRNQKSKSELAKSRAGTRTTLNRPTRRSPNASEDPSSGETTPSRRLKKLYRNAGNQGGDEEYQKTKRHMRGALHRLTKKESSVNEGTKKVSRQLRSEDKATISAGGDPWGSPTKKSNRILKKLRYKQQESGRRALKSNKDASWKETGSWEKKRAVESHRQGAVAHARQLNRKGSGTPRQTSNLPKPKPSDG